MFRGNFFLIVLLLWLRDNYQKTFLELSLLYVFNRFGTDLSIVLRGNVRLSKIKVRV